MIVRLATHADRLPKSSQRRSCLLAEPKDTAKSLDEAISVQPLVNSRGAGLAYDFFRFLRRPLKAWLAKHLADIEVFYLPSYSPELNPDERLNADLKHAISTRVPVRTKAKLHAAATNHMTFIKTHPERVKSYFQDPRVKYAA